MNRLICVEHAMFDFMQMRPGTARRKAIVDHVLRMGSLMVNRKHCLQTHEDVDLKRLLKKGVLKQERRARSRGTNYTHLVLA